METLLLSPRIWDSNGDLYQSITDNIDKLKSESDGIIGDYYGFKLFSNTIPSFSCAFLTNEMWVTWDKFSSIEVLQRDSYSGFVNNSIHIACCTDNFINDIIKDLPNQNVEYTPESVSGQWFIATTMVPDSFYPEIIAIKRNKTNYPYGDYDLLNIKLMPSAALEDAWSALRSSS